MLIFEGDEQGARKNLEIAQWYQGNTESIAMQYQWVAVYYALNQFDKAAALEARLAPLYYFKKQQQQQGVKTLLLRYCQHNQYASASCQHMVSSQVIPGPGQTP